jgi:retinol dehydrogenase-12
MGTRIDGKHIVVTGCTAGIGKAACFELAGRGARLTLLCRSAEKGEQLRADIQEQGDTQVDVILMDMADLSSVRAAAQALLDKDESVDVLLNNAGVVNTSRRETVDGFEETLAVNHFAPFLLTGMLLPLILKSGGGRIINTASDAHVFVRSMGFDDMYASKRFRTFREYGRSKLANILFTQSLSQRLAAHPVTVNCLHPGAVSTSLGTQNDGLLSKLLPSLLKFFFKTPEQGAETSIYLCCSDEVSESRGEYFVNSRIAKAKPWARDEEAAQQLWEFTEKAINFHYPNLS